MKSIISKSLVVLLILPLTLMAGGYSTKGQSNKIMGISGAGNSYVRDASISFYNPGAMGMLEGNMATGGFFTNLTRSAFNNKLSNDEAFDMEGGFFLPFHAYGVYKINDEISAGLSINTPFGEGSKWADDWTGRYSVQEMRLKTMFIQPTGSYKVNDLLQVGLGIIVANSSLKYRHMQKFGDVNTEYKDGAFGFGFNLGVFGQIQEGSYYGVSFRSPVQMKYSGTASFSNVPGSLTDYYSNGAYTSNFRLPSVFTASLTDQVTENIHMTYEFNFTSWKAVDSLVFDFENDQLDHRLNRDYKDAMTFKVGAEYLFNEQMTFRAGFYYDESPIQEATLSPIHPDGNALGFTAGASYVVNDQLEIDASLLYENQGKRYAKDVQLAFDGQYKAIAYQFGVGASYKF